MTGRLMTGRLIESEYTSWGSDTGLYSVWYMVFACLLWFYLLPAVLVFCVNKYSSAMCVK